MNPGEINEYLSKDLYKMLGVSRYASDNDIKLAWRNLARRYHPDTNPDNKASETIMKRINAAWSILSDPMRREYYDRLYYVGKFSRMVSGDENDYSHIDQEDEYSLIEAVPEALKVVGTIVIGGAILWGLDKILRK